MNPDNIPLNALIIGPTNCGKASYLVNFLRNEFIQKFDYIFLLCPTKPGMDLQRMKKTFFVIIPKQDQVNDWLRIISFAFDGTNTLLIVTASYSFFSAANFSPTFVLFVCYIFHTFRPHTFIVHYVCK